MPFSAVASIISADQWRDSPFRPPSTKQGKAGLNSSMKSLVASAPSWYPHSDNDLLGGSSTLLSLPSLVSATLPLHPPRLEKDFSPSETSSVSSPLLTPISTIFHSISPQAAKERIYPLGMFLSARRDALHTPHGVLLWCAKEYAEKPLLRVPSHLALSIHEVCSLDDGARCTIGMNLKNTRPRRVPQLQTKVMYILTRITPQKYPELLTELLELPLRQSSDSELQEIVNVFFDKASEEPEYSNMYSDLLGELCKLRESEELLDPELRNSLLCMRLRKTLLSTWERRVQVRLALSEDDKVDRTTGIPLDAEALDGKISRIKNKMIGCIIFVARLIVVNILPPDLIGKILRKIFAGCNFFQANEIDECTCELFSQFMTKTAHVLNTYNSEELGYYFAVAKAIRESCTRFRSQFMMEELEKMRVKNNLPLGDITKLPPSTENMNDNSSAGGICGNILMENSTSLSSGNITKGRNEAQKTLSKRNSTISLLSHAASELSLPSVENTLCSPLHETNILINFTSHHDKHALSLFGELIPEEKKSQLMEFLNHVLHTEQVEIGSALEALYFVAMNLIKSCTLVCIFTSYLRDDIHRSGRQVQILLSRLIKLRDFYLRDRSLRHSMLDFFVFSCFNLALLRYSRSRCRIESFLSLAYPAHIYSLADLPATENAEELLAVAACSNFRFFYAILPQHPSGSSRSEAPPNVMAMVQNACPELEKSFELHLYGWVTTKAVGWENHCVTEIQNYVDNFPNMLEKIIALMSIADVLLTCTAIFRFEGSPFFPVQSATSILARVVSALSHELFEAALLLEVFYHCNLYPVKYLSTRPISATQLLGALHNFLNSSGAFRNKCQTLKLLKKIAEDDQSALGIHFASLSSKNGLSLAQAVSIIKGK